MMPWAQIKAAALVNWHDLTVCDTTGHVRGKGKKTCLKNFLTLGPDVIDALKDLGIGDEPAPTVLIGCEKFLCSLFCPKNIEILQAKELRWYLFKQLKNNQSVENLPPTSGAWIEPTRRAHV